jgi:hypothetical protein
MSRLVESLKRLYTQGKVSEDKLNEMVMSGKISKEEFEYILG